MTTLPKAGQQHLGGANNVCSECQDAYATCHCGDCELSFCEACASEVHRRRTFRSHRIIPFDAPDVEGLDGMGEGPNDLDMSLGSVLSPAFFF